MAHSRLAMTLFSVYLLLYAGFVLLNAFYPDVMEATPWWGINVAVLYGFGLIVAAIGMALVYGLVTSWERPSHEPTGEPKGGRS